MELPCNADCSYGWYSSSRAIPIHILLLQFYHEVQESEPWMLADFSRFSKAFDNQSSKTEKDDATKLAADLDVCSN